MSEVLPECFRNVQANPCYLGTEELSKWCMDGACARYSPQWCGLAGWTNASAWWISLSHLTGNSFITGQGALHIFPPERKRQRQTERKGEAKLWKAWEPIKRRKPSPLGSLIFRSNCGVFFKILLPHILFFFFSGTHLRPAFQFPQIC